MRYYIEKIIVLLLNCIFFSISCSNNELNSNVKIVKELDTTSIDKIKDCRNKLIEKVKTKAKIYKGTIRRNKIEINEDNAITIVDKIVGDNVLEYISKELEFDKDALNIFFTNFAPLFDFIFKEKDTAVNRDNIPLTDSFNFYSVSTKRKSSIPQNTILGVCLSLFMDAFHAQNFSFIPIFIKQVFNYFPCNFIQEYKGYIKSLQKNFIKNIQINYYNALKLRCTPYIYNIKAKKMSDLRELILSYPMYRKLILHAYLLDDNIDIDKYSNFCNSLSNRKLANFLERCSLNGATNFFFENYSENADSVIVKRMQYNCDYVDGVINKIIKYFKNKNNSNVYSEEDNFLFKNLFIDFNLASSCENLENEAEVIDKFKKNVFPSLLLCGVEDLIRPDFLKINNYMLETCNDYWGIAFDLSVSIQNSSLARRSTKNKHILLEHNRLTDIKYASLQRNFLPLDRLEAAANWDDLFYSNQIFLSGKPIDTTYLKEIYMFFMLGIEDDFDEDLLSDSIKLLL